MSSSIDTGDASGVLNIAGPHWTAELFLYNSAFRRIGSGIGSLRKRVAPGLYEIEAILVDKVQRIVIAVRPGQESDVPSESWSIKIASAAPLTQTSTTHDVQQSLARKISTSITWEARSGGTSQLFVFVRTLELNQPFSIDQGLELVDAQEQLVTNFSEGVIYDFDQRFLAFSTRLPPGAYQLRVRQDKRLIRCQSLWLSPGYQTQVFIPVNTYPVLADLALFMRLGMGFDPDDDQTLASEVLRQGLQRGRNLAASRYMNPLVTSTFDNPWLGILAAHALDLEVRPSTRITALRRKVVRKVRQMVPDHPDVRALNLPLDSLDIEAFPYPPLLWASLKRIQEQDLRQANLITADSLTGRIFDQLILDSSWVAWRHLDHTESVIAVTAGVESDRLVNIIVDQEGIGLPGDSIAELVSAAERLRLDPSQPGIIVWVFDLQSVLNTVSLEPMIRELALPRSRIQQALEHLRADPDLFQHLPALAPIEQAVASYVMRSERQPQEVVSEFGAEPFSIKRAISALEQMAMIVEQVASPISELARDGQELANGLRRVADRLLACDDAILITDARGTVRYSNRAWEALSAYLQLAETENLTPRGLPKTLADAPLGFNKQEAIDFVRVAVNDQATDKVRVVLYKLHGREQPALTTNDTSALRRFVSRLSLYQATLEYGTDDQIQGQLESMGIELEQLIRLLYGVGRPVIDPNKGGKLIGRTKEVRRVKRAILSSDVQLLTLTGPGGRGKTAIALEVAKEVSEQFMDGVYFVPLGAVRDRGVAIFTIAQKLDVLGIGPDQTTNIRNYLRDKNVLLVLDAIESIPMMANWLRELFNALPKLDVPSLKILVTKRIPVGLAKEYKILVPPLGSDVVVKGIEEHEFLPSSALTSADSIPSDMVQPAASVLSDLLAEPPQLSAAVQLFFERASAVKPSLDRTLENIETVGEICRLLEGLPLAIELVAARTSSLTPQSVLQQLAPHLSQRQSKTSSNIHGDETLHNVIAWSYDQLDVPEQIFFQRLSVFAHSFTLHAAQIMAMDAYIENIDQAFVDVHPQLPVPNMDAVIASDVAKRMSALVASSLVLLVEQAGHEQRYSMLDPVREYANERLIESGQAIMFQQRHAAYYLALVEQTEPKLINADRGRAVVQLKDEQDNLLIALGWFAKSNAQQSLLRLVGALWWYWLYTNAWSEGRTWLNLALASADGVNTNRAKVLLGIGALAWLQSDYELAHERLEESVTIWRSLDNQRQLAHALVFLGLMPPDYFPDGYNMALIYIEEGVKIFRTVSDNWGLARALNDQGNVANADHQYEKAEKVFLESIELWRSVGDKWGLGLPLGGLTTVSIENRDFERAQDLAEEALILRQQAGTRGDVGAVLSQLGQISRHQRKYAQATQRYNEALVHFREMKIKSGVAWCLHNLGYIALAQNDLKRARGLLAESLVMHQDLEDDWNIANCILGLAAVVAAEGELEKAARLSGALVKLEKEEDHWEINRVTYQQWLQFTASRLGAPLFEALQVEGKSMLLDRLISYALENDPTA